MGFFTYIIKRAIYYIWEKLKITKKHLVSKQRSEHGHKADLIKLNKTVLEQVIAGYTKESGVRNLDRKIAGIMRGVARRVAMEEPYNVNVTKEDIELYLGPKLYDDDKYVVSNTAGIAVGLAWTQVGGDILFIESSLSKGKGKLTLTGNLGDVMKESATTALSYIKAHAAELSITDSRFEETDIHIHVPEGAIPKDGSQTGARLKPRPSYRAQGQASQKEVPGQQLRSSLHL